MPDSIAPISSISLPAAYATRPEGDRELFASAIARAQSRPGETREEQARSAAQQLISTALISPVLSQMRQSTWAAAPFKPNQAERTFGQIYDATLAQRLVQSTRWPLVDAVARRMLGGTPTPMPQTPPVKD